MRKKVLTLFIVLMASLFVKGQTVLNTLSDLRDAVEASGQNVKLAPGNYIIEDLPSGDRFFHCSGSNNVIDLTGVYIEFPVDATGDQHFLITGSDNLLRGGVFENTYEDGTTEITDYLAYNNDRNKFANGEDPHLVIQGDGNKVVGVKMIVRGSFPYGYGSIYEINNNNQFGLSKRGGIAVQGTNVVIDSCELQMRAFGHGVYIQSPYNHTVIKNIIVIGDLRLGSELLAETDPSSLPSRSNFMDFSVDHENPSPIDPTRGISLCEDGIRLYNNGGSMEVINCRVEKMRGGIRGYLGSGSTVVNSTALDCESTNFNLPNGGSITNSFGNFAYCPLSDYRLNRSNTDVELTIIPSPHASGSHNILDLNGNNHDVIFNRSSGPEDTGEERAIVVTGDNSDIINETEYTIILEDGASGNTVTSCGPVIDNGSGNTVILTTGCLEGGFCNNRTAKIEAECFDEMFGVKSEDINSGGKSLAFIENEDWVVYHSIDLSDVYSVEVVASSARQGGVNSLGELSNYLNQDNVNVKLTPGTYTVTEQDVLDKLVGDYETINERAYYTLFVFAGNGSTYDFTDVTINVETAVFRSVGNYTLWEMRLAGNDMVLKNLTLVDLGSASDAPRKTVNNIVMDGRNNVVDGFNVRSTGSYPYGYGDIFGKGANPIVQQRKHSAILIRGESNTLKNTNLVHKAYGHCVFFQGSSFPVVDGCYIEGEIRTSDDMLLEEGTGTIGDQKGFMTVWDYKLPSGFMVALCEAGIRAYNSGSTVIDGELIERGTSNVTVKNTTVRNTRTACTLAHSTGTQYVENVTSIGNENGFSIGNGQVVNCRSDVAYGSAISGENRVTGEVTLIEPENGYLNGSNVVAEVTGGDITLYSDEGLVIPSDLFVKMGTFRSFRHQEGSSLLYQLDTIFSGAIVYNYTGATVELGAGASNNDIYTCGEVIDLGSNNSIEILENCQDIQSCTKTTDLTEAECYDNMSGIQTQESSEGTDNVGWIQNGDWTLYEGIDISGMYSINARVATKTLGGKIEVRIDGDDGALIGTLEIGNTGGNQVYETVSVNIEETEGEHDIYLVYTGGEGYLFNVNWFGFSQEFLCTDKNVSHIEAECFDEMNGVKTEPCDEGTLNVGFIEDGDWLKFNDLDLTNLNEFKVRVASNKISGEIEVRLDNENWQLLGSLPVMNTGGWQSWVSDSADITKVDGVHDVVLLFKGDQGALFNINHFEFSENTSVVTDINSSVIQNIKLYPNPAKNQITSSGAEGGSYELFSQIGVKHLTGVVKSNNQLINPESLPKGVCFVKIKLNENTVVEKIIIE